MKSFLTFLAIFAISPCLYADEAEQVERLAEKYNAKTEVTLWDNTRADLVNDEYAFEVDWPHRYSEAVGQALYYAAISGKKPAIILLVRDVKAEQRHLYRAAVAATAAGVKFHLEDYKPPVMSRQPIGQLKEGDTPTRVYMVFDPKEEAWYGVNPFGLTVWTVQNKAEVWTSKRDAERALEGMFGSSRARRAEVKAFVLIPVSDKKPAKDHH